jgi:hypothetical protein
MNETFCKLQDVSGEFVAVNPRHVRYIRRQKAPATMLASFISTTSIVLQSSEAWKKSPLH